MTSIKIVSNPYEQKIQYFIYDDFTKTWVDINEKNPNSRLREDSSVKTFFPFKICEIIDTIIEEYHTDGEIINVVFEGTQDDFYEAELVCSKDRIQDKIKLTRGTSYLTNARYIFKDIKDIFGSVEVLIKELMQDDSRAIADLNKVSDALKDIIPICVFGNYSCGKSTFINALIGVEVLPSGGDPVTAKVYEIKRSEHLDRAFIHYEYESEPCDIIFEGKDIKINFSNMDNDLIKEIQQELDNCDESNLVLKVNHSLELINGFEKRDRARTIISNIIEIEVPFSKEGVLGNSLNNFVIFDTPGSNSASNEEHFQVLSEALAGFSNGIPVWVSTYESADSEDNAKLCQLVESIDALDKRFTMIVFNKADCSELGEDGLSQRQIDDILEFSSVEKMYAGGVYFVSSIMGLGSKCNGNLTDKHYRREYRTHQFMYEEPDDEDYTSLYRYNIMPEQIKENTVAMSEDCDRLIYANSGLYCIESEMENFATKHSAYNKCKMADSYLDSIIDKTTKKINRRVEIRKGTMNDLDKKLGVREREVINRVKKFKREESNRIAVGSEPRITIFVKNELHFEHSSDDIEKLDTDFFEQHSKDNHLKIQQKEYDSASKELVNHLLANFKRLGKTDVQKRDTIKDVVSDLKREFKEDSANWRFNRSELADTKENVSKLTADNTIQSVIAEYIKNMDMAYNMIITKQRGSWSSDADLFKEGIKNQIVGSDELTEDQKTKLESIIMSFPPYQYDDKAEELFTKEKFVKSNFLKLNLGEIERINTKSLARAYNREIKRNILEMAISINDKYRKSFGVWVDELYSIIEQNITSYNPELKALVEEIEEQRVTIRKLETDRESIQNSKARILDLMSWIQLEE